MAVFKRKDSRYWWFKFTTADGTKVCESAKTDSKKLAEEVEAKRRRELFEESQLGVIQDRPLKEAVEFFLKKKRLEGKRTVDTYEQQLEWWLDELAGVTLKKLSEKHIVDAMLKKQETPTRMKTLPAPATLNRYIAALRACLNVVKECGWLHRVPTFVGYDEDNERVRWLSNEEREALLREAPESWVPLIRISLATGLRQGNVLGMRWEWVDMEYRMLSIPGQFFKNGYPFCIPLNEEAMAVIREQQGMHPDFVFVSRVIGQPITQINHYEWKALLTRAGIEDLRWHDLRHSWATSLARDGVPFHALKSLGGWKSDVAQRYIHHDVESLRQFAEGKPKPSHVSGYREKKRHLKLVA